MWRRPSLIGYKRIETGYYKGLLQSLLVISSNYSFGWGAVALACRNAVASCCSRSPAEPLCGLRGACCAAERGVCCAAYLLCRSPAVPLTCRAGDLLPLTCRAAVLPLESCRRTCRWGPSAEPTAEPAAVRLPCRSPAVLGTCRRRPAVPGGGVILRSLRSGFRGLRLSLPGPGKPSRPESSLLYL